MKSRRAHKFSSLLFLYPTKNTNTKERFFLQTAKHVHRGAFR
ncbi:hypothetical protein BFO_2275 [Tannerella forsythia 92A2]|uniref:Uncharacterized protein n=1 Tax=Tannerella forsythia (strain ATCC 43037 / JCM 10827 / CCUG 21028 A / KCTC 5666 / FDC 338) TaxID=203275 RepID=G8UJV4_TANFA|nr:hypothetical protein BFO_2275 [Tannerella forsythia 92A2]